MLKADHCSLKVLSMRDNFLKAGTAQLMKEALETNCTMIKVNLDFNPVSRRILEDIDAICSRNLALDEIDQKNKNLALQKQQRKPTTTQKQSLNSEIKDLKLFTDNAVKDATDFLAVVEKKQRTRKSSRGHYQSLMPMTAQWCPSATTIGNISRDQSS